MDEPPLSSLGTDAAIVTEQDLHEYVDGRQSPARRAAVETFLEARPEIRARVSDWQRQNATLRKWLNPVTEQVVPQRLTQRLELRKLRWQRIAASVAFVALSFGVAWSIRGRIDGRAFALVTSRFPVMPGAKEDGVLNGFARRAAIAHVVYSPDEDHRREPGVEDEQALVGWLTKGMGGDVRAPSLKALGFELIGGRLLPGEHGPVAIFMYGSSEGVRLTLYVTRDVAGKDQSFQFGHDGPVNVFYWIDRRIGYAISAGADRNLLLKVSNEVHRQLEP